MQELKQAIHLARRLMASGLTGSELATGLQPIASYLSASQKDVLLQKINKEYLILGHAAHDPNLYKSCEAARLAKKKAKNAQLKILTYKTPMCPTCSWNRRGNCGLMGGRLLADPARIPEIVVQRTADIMIRDQLLPEQDARKIAASAQHSTIRVASLHKQLYQETQTQKSTRELDDVNARSQSRRHASILEPGEFSKVHGRHFVAKTATNPEKTHLPDYDENVRDVHSRVNAAFEPQDSFLAASPEPRMRGRVTADAVRGGVLPARSPGPGGDSDAPDVQRALSLLTKQASRLLSSGRVSATVAGRLLELWGQLEGVGARPTRRTARIRRQLHALVGGLEL